MPGQLGGAAGPCQVGSTGRQQRGGSYRDCSAAPSQSTWLPCIQSPNEHITRTHLAMLIELAPLSSAADGRRGGTGDGGSGGRQPRLLSGLPGPPLAGLLGLARCSCTLGSCAHCCRLPAPLLPLVVVVLVLDAGHSARA